MGNQNLAGYDDIIFEKEDEELSDDELRTVTFDMEDADDTERELSEDEVEIITEAPYDDVVADYIEVVPRRINEKTKKIIAVCVMILIFIGFPISSTLLTRTARDQTVCDLDSVRDQAYSSLQDETGPGRFGDTNDLTLYLDSGISSTISYEKSLENKYRNGELDLEEYSRELSQCLKDTDNLSHLLAVNKKTYIDEGREEEFDSLSDEMDTLILYGESLSFGIRDGK